MSRVERSDFYKSFVLESQTDVGLTDSSQDLINGLTRYAHTANIPLKTRVELETTAGKLVHDWTNDNSKFEKLDIAASDFDDAKDLTTCADYVGTIVLESDSEVVTA
jgi:hypothetical protein